MGLTDVTMGVTMDTDAFASDLAKLDNDAFASDLAKLDNGAFASDLAKLDNGAFASDLVNLDTEDLTNELAELDILAELDNLVEMENLAEMEILTDNVEFDMGTFSSDLLDVKSETTTPTLDLGEELADLPKINGIVNFDFNLSADEVDALQTILSSETPFDGAQDDGVEFSWSDVGPDMVIPALPLASPEVGTEKEAPTVAEWKHYVFNGMTGSTIVE